MSWIFSANISRWWPQIFPIFTPIFEEMIKHWLAYIFQIGLKPPTRFASHWFIVVVSQNLRPSFSGKSSWAWPNSNDVPKKTATNLRSQHHFHHYPETNSKRPWKSMVGRWTSFRLAPGLFSGANLLLVFTECNQHRYWRTHRATSATPVPWLPYRGSWRWGPPLGSLSRTIVMWGNQTIQMCGHFEESTFSF